MDSYYKKKEIQWVRIKIGDLNKFKFRNILNKLTKFGSCIIRYCVMGICDRFLQRYRVFTIMYSISFEISKFRSAL